MTTKPGTARRWAKGAAVALAGLFAATFVFGITPAAIAQTEQQQPAAAKDGEDGNGEITGDRKSPLLSIQREREPVVVPVACAEGIQKDVELQPADASVTFTFNCLCSEDANGLKQAMMRYRDDYLRVYRGEIKLDDMGTASDYFSEIALPFSSDGKGGTALTLLLEPGQKQERTLHCYTSEDFKIIDDWAKYIIFGN
ncbi:MAG: hypothetical protein GY791_11670 [Alphaproteobacteria bacterium]|nr:hypothetical protein [Alphaproteobacteria bacterium]